MEDNINQLYQTLADVDEIRLLHLQPGAKNESLISQVVRSSLVNEPKYEALSYMWGSKESPLQIELNERTIEVRNNLWLALHHLRLADTARILWIDALCINQDDIIERNHQVSQMGRIYENAQCVLAWLGISDESSLIAMEYITSFQPRLRELFWLQDILPKDPIVIDRHIIEAISSFCSREYWNRLWIVQELILASRVTILCGRRSCDWNQFAFFLDSAQDNGIIQSSIDQTSSLEMDIEFSAFIASQAMRIAQGRSIYVSRSLQPLVFFCGEYKLSQCEDRRDRVFGLRAFALRCCRDAVPVDYTISMTELCWTLISHYSSRHSSSRLNISLARDVFQSLRLTKQELEGLTLLLRAKRFVEDLGDIKTA